MAKNEQGRYFIAYKGKHVDPIEIHRYMATLVPDGFYEKSKVIQKNGDSSMPSHMYRDGETNLVYFGKIVPRSDQENREPYYYGSYGTKLITVSGYDQKQLEEVYKQHYKRIYSISEPSFYHSLFNMLISDYDIDGLIDLRNKALWFNTVYYYQDGKDESLTGYVSGQNNEYTHLYFGYPSEDALDEVMFSNKDTIIEKFCPHCFELHNNCYIIDGKAYDSEKKRIAIIDAIEGRMTGSWTRQSSDLPAPLAKDLAELEGYKPNSNSNSSNSNNTNNNSINSSISSNDLEREERIARMEAIRQERERLAREAEEESRRQANNINSILGRPSNPVSRPVGESPSLNHLNTGRPLNTSRTLDTSYADLEKSNIEKKLLAVLMPLILTDESKKKIKAFIENDLDTATREKIEEIMDEIIAEYNIDDCVAERIGKIIDQKIEEHTKNISIPQVNIIKLNDVEVGRVEGEFFHCRFNDILTSVVENEPLMLVGPAGSGKNHTIGQVARGLGLDMHYTNCATNEFKLTGFIDAGGTYRETEFYKAFKNGGLFFLDEIDTSDPSSLIVLNSALENGYMPYPHEVVDKHPDFRMVAAANTYGKGSDIQYVGRNALDASTLDRFDILPFDYDRNLERALYPDEQVLEFMWALRDALAETDIKHIISTRGIRKLYKKAKDNVPIDLALQTAVIKNLTKDDIESLVGLMNIDHDNKYYQATKNFKFNR